VAALETLFFSGLLYAFLLLFILPIGHNLSSFLLRGVSRDLQLLVSFGLGVLAIASITITLALLGLPNETIRLLLFLLWFLTAFFWFASGRFREWACPDWRSIFVIVFLLLSITTLYGAFPDGGLENPSGSLTMQLTRLPVDNMIPYNVSRLLVERINPTLVDIVPAWKFTDRGPLAGFFFASASIALGLEDAGHWGGSDQGIFFAYQFTMSFLNALSLIAVWAVAKKHLGDRAAWWSIILLSTSYFYLLNIFFSWPKFLMASYMLSGITLWCSTHKLPQRLDRSMIVVGLFCAAAMLSHDSAAFFIAAFGVVVGTSFIWRINRSKKSMRNALSLCSSAALGLFPWILYKKLFLPPSNRGPFYHFFCYYGTNTEGVTYSSLWQDYLSKHDWSEIVSIRLGNILLPVDPSRMFDLVTTYWSNPLLLIGNAQTTIFGQLIAGTGPIVFALSIFGLSKILYEHLRRVLQRKSGAKTSADSHHMNLLENPVLVFTAVAILGMTLTAITAGCAQATINHVCGYLGFLCVALTASYATKNSGMWTGILLGIHCGLNLFAAMVYLFYHAIPMPFLHGSFVWALTIALAMILFISLTLQKLVMAGGDSENVKK